MKHRKLKLMDIPKFKRQLAAVEKKIEKFNRNNKVKM